MPPKLLRKRVQAGMATQMPAGSQVKGSSVQGSQAGSQVKGSLAQGSEAGMGTAVSMANPCWRCIKHWVECIVASNGA